MPKPAPSHVLADIRSTVATLEEQDFYQRLGVERDTDIKQVRRAYMKLAAKWHPDRFAQYTLAGEDQASIQRLFALMTEAHTTLTDDAKREEYNAKLDFGGESASIEDILGADNLFRMGQRLVEHGKFKAALQKFEKACEINPDSPEFHAYRAWAFYMTIPRTQGGRPKQVQYVDECIRILTQAIEDLENFDMGHVFLGQIYLDRDQDEDAVANFKAAMKINPKNSNAQRQLRLYNMRESQRSEGFLSKLFSRFKK